MKEDYKDINGNLPQEGVYLEKGDLLQVRYVFENFYGDWIFEDETGQRACINPTNFRDFRIVSPEEARKLMQIASLIQKVKDRLEQLAQSKEVILGEGCCDNFKSHD